MRIFVEGPITVPQGSSDSRSEVEVEVVDRLFVLANLVPIDRGDNVKKPAPTLRTFVPR
jgi:hypothetical protein